MSNYKYDSDYTFKTDSNPNKKYKGIFKEQGENDEEMGGGEVEGMSAIRKDLMLFRNKFCTVNMIGIGRVSIITDLFVKMFVSSNVFVFRTFGKSKGTMTFFIKYIKNFIMSGDKQSCSFDFVVQGKIWSNFLIKIVQ